MDKNYDEAFFVFIKHPVNDEHDDVDDVDDVDDGDDDADSYRAVKRRGHSYNDDDDNR